MDNAGSTGGIAALLAAAVWGTADFVGGLATRQRNQYHVLALVSFSGLLCLIAASLIKGESWPDLPSVLWSVGAGVSGGLGIAALYRGLTLVDAAIVAPSAGVIGASLPVLVETIAHGATTPQKVSGIVLGVAGIWLVSGGTLVKRAGEAVGLKLAFAAGLGFGGFFLLIAQVSADLVFTPLVVAKAMALATAIVAVVVQRLGVPSLAGSGLALAAGVMDAAGNVLYLLAAQRLRVELAAVISSMGPGMTVLLATLISKQRVSPSQKIGVGLCLLAIALILL